MSRDVGIIFRKAVYDQETDQVFLMLLTLDHPDLSVPIRVVNDSQDVPAGGSAEQPFVAFPFELTWANDKADRPPKAQLRIDNVDRQIINTLRSLSGRVHVKVELVRAAAPLMVEATLPDFEISEVTYDALVVQGDLTMESFVNEPYPAQRFTPASHPGLF